MQGLSNRIIYLHMDQEGDAPAAGMEPGQLLTGDHNLVNVTATLYYKVRPEAVEDYVAEGDRVEGLLDEVGVDAGVKIFEKERKCGVR